jgi:chorismate mutase
MEKRKVGRPKKTSKPVVEQKKVVESWKAKYEQLLVQYTLREETADLFIENARQVIEEQADKQLDIVKLTLDSYSTMEKHCTEVFKLTGSIDESDILYLTSVARRALLHKFVEFNEAQED